MLDILYTGTYKFCFEKKLYNKKLMLIFANSLRKGI